MVYMKYVTIAFLYGHASQLLGMLLHIITTMNSVVMNIALHTYGEYNKQSFGCSNKVA